MELEQIVAPADVMLADEDPRDRGATVGALDHQLAHGTTRADWDWGGVPYASSNAGDVDYRGADDEWCDFCGSGDGTGVIEPDKVGELGFAYVR